MNHFYGVGLLLTFGLGWCYSLTAGFLNLGSDASHLCREFIHPTVAPLFPMQLCWFTGYMKYMWWILSSFQFYTEHDRRLNFHSTPMQNAFCIHLLLQLHTFLMSTDHINVPWAIGQKIYFRGSARAHIFSKFPPGPNGWERLGYRLGTFRRTVLSLLSFRTRNYCSQC